MEKRLLLLVSAEDGCWGALAEKYHDRYSIEDVLELARRRYLEVLREEYDEVCDVEGELQDETDQYILTYEDGMGETMRIYEK